MLVVRQLIWDVVCLAALPMGHENKLVDIIGLLVRTLHTFKPFRHVYLNNAEDLCFNVLISTMHLPWQAYEGWTETTTQWTMVIIWLQCTFSGWYAHNELQQRKMLIVLGTESIGWEASGSEAQTMRKGSKCGSGERSFDYGI